MRRELNMMSKVIAFISVIILFISICALDSPSYLPVCTAVISGFTFVISALINGWFTLSESEDE